MKILINLKSQDAVEKYKAKFPQSLYYGDYWNGVSGKGVSCYFLTAEEYKNNLPFLKEIKATKAHWYNSFLKPKKPVFKWGWQKLEPGDYTDHIAFKKAMLEYRKAIKLYEKTLKQNL